MMRRRFRNVTLSSNGALETSVAKWHESKYPGNHRTDALYNELGFRAHRALMQENNEVNDIFPLSTSSRFKPNVYLNV
jgi:hypothetical protein